MPKSYLLLLFLIAFYACKPYDTIITNGTIYDGTGGAPYQADLGIKKEQIKSIGKLDLNKSKVVIDAAGKAVSPGFINMLSWANWSVLEDGRSMSDIKQGVTLEIFGEGSSMGPRKPGNERDDRRRPWTTLGEYLEYAEKKGVSTNVASFVGATTVRIHELGYDDREPTPEELERMKDLVRQAMREGAMGLGSSLIYPPAFFATTEELIELAEAAAEYDGMYISHLRSEGNNFLAAVNEFLTIASEADIRAEIYHLKAAGQSNWYKLDLVLEKLDSAREAGLEVTTNMYTYTAASTGIDATLPPWVQEGGLEKFLERLRDPETRQQVVEQVKTPSDDWENFYLMSGKPENILLVGFSEDSLRHLTGKNLAEAAAFYNQDPVETIIDLIIKDGGDIGAVYFLMSEENVKRQLQLPYMTFGSDGGSVAAEGEELKYATHPRTYGNFARLLGKYVREEKVLSLEDAIHRLTYLPALRLRIDRNRGRLAPGYQADVVVFDPATITDKATFAEPHQYAEGVEYVFVNGELVIRNGEHTGAMPGQFVKGPGYKK